MSSTKSTTSNAYLSGVSLTRAAIVPLTLVVLTALSRGGQPNGVALEDHLAAGEFAPARRLALEAPTAAQRDQGLREVALAQLSSGAFRASLETAAEIGSDSVRGDAFSHIRSRGMASPHLRGGGPQADFDSLIELITTTIAPDTWEDVGGDGAITSFEGGGGVFVDAQGLMHRIDAAPREKWLQDVHRRSQSVGENHDLRKTSALRRVSLPRLERQIQRLWAQGRLPSEAMQVLAGLQRVQYILVYPESGDLVLAGPAGDWQYDAEGRPVSAESGDPVVMLDDLVVVMRNALDGNGRFGCSITPRQQNLAQAHSFLEASARSPLRQGRRRAWLGELRGHLGKQDIEVYGIDPRTHTARVIVEADYHMKLIGMGLVDGVAGVTSYLDSIRVVRGEAPPTMGVLRWWFALNYASVEASPKRNAFALSGPGVKVQSENELLTELGERIHTGTSDELNQRFAASFTRQFEALAQKYPVYAQLRDVFDLALVAALLRSEDLFAQVNWQAVHFRDPQRYQVALAPEAKEVESVVNHRVIDRKHVVAGVSGGVQVDARAVLASAGIRTGQYSELATYQAETAAPSDRSADRWWWD
jgi:hypothetical protein